MILLYEMLLYSTVYVQFWQVELDEDPLYGGPIAWGDRIRLRHFTTRKYLTSV